MTNKEMIEPWRQYGVRLEKEDTVDGVTHLYISVPKMSDFFDDNGNELSGALLAKRVKRSISDPIVLRSRTRNERWTKEHVLQHRLQTGQKERAAVKPYPKNRRR